MAIKSTKSPVSKKVVAEKPPAPAKIAPSQSLGKLVLDLNKKFGANAVTLGVPKTVQGEEAFRRISTGSISLDIALGGGLPLGRFIEISGAYSSTKTTLSLHIVRSAQSEGLVCGVIDVEGTIDDKFLKALGVNTETLFYSRPDSMEEACQLVLDLQRSGEVQLVVLDSIAAMSPNKEQDTMMDETMRMGIPQTLLGEFFRKYQANNNRLSREGKETFTLTGINQLREKIGAYGDWLVA